MQDKTTALISAFRFKSEHNNSNKSSFKKIPFLDCSTHFLCLNKAITLLIPEFFPTFQTIPETHQKHRILHKCTGAMTLHPVTIEPIEPRSGPTWQGAEDFSDGQHPFRWLSSQIVMTWLKAQRESAHYGKISTERSYKESMSLYLQICKALLRSSCP